MISRILGTREFDKDSRRLFKNYFLLTILMTSVRLIADAFFILYILDRIGYSKTSLLLAIRFLTQAVIDYPTGALGDWIGHKRVIFIAYISHSFTFVLLGSLLFFSPSNIVIYLIFISILQSFSLAQESGALQSWFDNGYNEIAKANDPEKEIYSGVFGKTQILGSVIGIFTIMIGGLIAEIWSREILFLFQACVTLFIAFIGYRAMTGFAEKEKPILTLTNYQKMLTNGIKVAIKSRKIFFLSITYILITIFITTWGALFLFPIYFGYSGSDQQMASLRTVIFALGLPISILGVMLAKKLKPEKWIPILLFFFSTVWIALYSYIFTKYPLPLTEAEASFNLSAIVFVVIAALYLRFLAVIFLTLYQKLMVELIPDEHRNSYYSLIPTIGVLLNA